MIASVHDPVSGRGASHRAPYHQVPSKVEAMHATTTHVHSALTFKFEIKVEN
jgi:hypothetical protein